MSNVPSLPQKQAAWLTFKALCSLQLNKDTFESEDDPVVDFSTTLLEIADKTIPKSSISSKPRKPWFDSECKQVIKERKKAEKSFRRSPCHSNMNRDFYYDVYFILNRI